MIKRPDTKAQRLKRHKRVRAKISGTPARPRLNVFRSLNHIYAQIIDDVNGNTLVAASSVEKDFGATGGNCEAAKKVGQLVAERAIAKGSKKWSLTAAAMSITAASRAWQRVPVRAASSSKGKEIDHGLQ